MGVKPTYDEPRLRRAIAAQRAVTRSGYRGDGVEVEPDELEALLDMVRFLADCVAKYSESTGEIEMILDTAVLPPPSKATLSGQVNFIVARLAFYFAQTYSRDARVEALEAVAAAAQRFTEFRARGENPIVELDERGLYELESDLVSATAALARSESSR